MKELKIIGWTKYGNMKYPRVDTVTPGMIDLIVNTMRENGFKWSGYYHQRGIGGVPVVNIGDGMSCMFSLRKWGYIMNQAYPDNDDDMGYVNWAWGDFEEPVYPSEELILT